MFARGDGFYKDKSRQRLRLGSTFYPIIKGQLIAMNLQIMKFYFDVF